ncbi:hypothetical protein [Corynebacterium urogenitale]|uniref:hypothetical protein n=1 Tax=Corynebacterium urogenitale TaxID=2487892 RepID=UPI00125FE0AF|nr:hypothetical protein [Corynebacterium urogenitale]
MKHTYVIIYPDNARPSAVWGVDEAEENAFCSAAHQALKSSPHTFDGWIREWRENFQSDGRVGVAQRWNSSFDPLQWIADGERLSSVIEANTNYRIVRAFKAYARNPKTVR